MEPIELTRETCVRRSENVVFRELAGDSVLLDLKTGSYFGLDAVGTRIWAFLDSGARLGDVLAGILEEYEVDEVTAWKDLVRLVGELVAHGLVRA